MIDTRDIAAKKVWNPGEGGKVQLRILHSYGTHTVHLEMSAGEYSLLLLGIGPAQMDRLFETLVYKLNS